MANITIYDMHCHTHDFTPAEIENFIEQLRDLKIVSVSEDLETFNKTLELYMMFPDIIIPCSGLHPWNIGKVTLQEVEELIRQTYRNDIFCIGEVGLDKKFVDPTTWSAQIDVFSKFLKLATEIDAYVTIHSPGAWREALTLLVEYNVRKAMFHWYTGPKELIDKITVAGFYISINPALKIQKKHQEIARITPLEYLVLESDGPYNYRGLRLSPLMIPESISLIAQLKDISKDLVASRAAENSRKLLNI